MILSRTLADGARMRLRSPWSEPYAVGAPFGPPKYIDTPVGLGVGSATLVGVQMLTRGMQSWRPDNVMAEHAVRDGRRKRSLLLFLAYRPSGFFFGSVLACCVPAFT